MLRPHDGGAASLSPRSARRGECARRRHGDGLAWARGGAAAAGGVGGRGGGGRAPARAGGGGRRPGAGLLAGAVSAPLPKVPAALAPYACRNNAMALAALTQIEAPVRA